jgi:hypothetical protein
LEDSEIGVILGVTFTTGISATLSTYTRHLTMAWRCSAVSNTGLVDNLFRAGVIKDQVAQAMRKVDRGHFVLDKRMAYQDSPQLVS